MEKTAENKVLLEFRKTIKLFIQYLSVVLSSIPAGIFCYAMLSLGIGQEVALTLSICFGSVTAIFLWRYTDKSLSSPKISQKPVNIRRLLEGVNYFIKFREEVIDFAVNKYIISENINLTGGTGNFIRIIQGTKDSQITIQRQIVDEVSREMNDVQKQTMEKLSDEVISQLEKELAKLGKENDELKEVKKGKWETKVKFAIPFIPLEFSRTATPDEFISKVQKRLYGGDLQLNILEAKEEAKGLLNE